MADSELVHTLTIQSWTLYSVAFLSTVGRLLSRRIKFGAWRNLMFEDYLICFAMACFTGVIFSVNETARNGSNYMSPEQTARLTPQEVDMAIYGSKMTLVLELFQLTCLWSAKACLVILYYRLSYQREANREGFKEKQNIIVAVGWYCAITFVLVNVMFLAYWCRPIQEYWRVPVKHSQCATYYHHMILATACNISSDLMLLAFPVVLVSTTSMELKKKIIIIAVLSLGVFSILTAVLNRYYNFSNPNSFIYVFWYVGESSTAIMVVNLPLCWPLLQRLIRIGPWTEPGARSRTASQLQQHRASRWSRKTQSRRPQHRFGIGVGRAPPPPPPPPPQHTSGSTTLLSVSSTLEDMAVYGLVSPPSWSASGEDGEEKVKKKKSAHDHLGFDIELQLAPPRRAELDIRALEAGSEPQGNAVGRSSLASGQEDGGVCARTTADGCRVAEPSQKGCGLPAYLRHS